MESLINTENIIPTLVVVTVIVAILRRKRERENHEETKWMIDVIALVGTAISSTTVIGLMAALSLFYYIYEKQG